MAKTDGYISCPAIVGKEARVYGGNSDIGAAVYSIPEVMLKAMIDEHLVTIATTRIDGRRYRLTEKAMRQAARSRASHEAGNAAS